MHSRGCMHGGGMHAMVCARWAMHGRRGAWQRVCVLGGMCAGGMHARKADTEAGTTHPTGMHSCCDMCLVDLD